MNNAIITNSTNPELGKYQQLAEKCMKLVKNKLYFKHKALSPAIYRMPINYVDPGIGIFGTDANQVYADPMDVISRYKNSPERLIRSYLHMLFHCIYLHPFQTQLNIDNGVWNIALDICCENAVMRLNPEAIDGDVERQQIIAGIKGKVKMFIPELVYNELMQNQSNYNFFDLTALFHMDDHVWLNPPQSGKGNSNDEDDDDNPYQNPNAQSQQGNGDDDQNQQNQQGDGNGNGEDGQDENQQGGDGNGNNNNKNRNNQNRQNQQNSQGNNNQDKRKEWSDVSRQVAADMSSFNKGDGAGDLMQEIDFLTEDKMEYDEFLRAFSVTEEVMKINEDEFDYIAYTSKEEVGLKNLAERGASIKAREQKEARILRKMDRSRRAMNPENYNDDGTVRRGKKTWKKSNRYKKLHSQYRNICRIAAENRHLAINEEVNHMRALGNVFITEPKNAKKLQKRSKKTERQDKPSVVQKSDGTEQLIYKYKRKKRHGKSIKNRCPGYFQAQAKAKFERTGGVYIEVSATYRASQYDHTCNKYIKKALSQRMYELTDGTRVQRDWYSSFLMYCIGTDLQNISRYKCKRYFDELYVKYLKLEQYIINNKITVMNSGIKFKAA